MSENGVDLACESVDPRVQIELERLNSATDDINKLEVDLDGSRETFRSLLCDSAARLDGLSRKLGSCIEKARPYYEARMRASEAAREAQDAAVQFERANSAHSAAREMVYLAEQGLGGKCTLDPAWQEMLNHATQRVNEAESARATAASQHMRIGKRLGETASVAQKLQRELRKSIAKSSLSARRNLLRINSLAYQYSLISLPYFEMKAQFNQHLELQKIRVQSLEKQVSNAKLTYAEALRNLEQISDEIHRNRKKSQTYHEIEFKQTKPPEPTTPISQKQRYSVASFPEYPYSESDTSVFYNQTYIPDSQTITANLNQHADEIDEYKTLPNNISPNHLQKGPIEEVSGYKNLPDVDENSPMTKSLTNEWTEINLDSSSPEEIQNDLKVDTIPYERFDISPEKVVNVTPKRRLIKQLTLPTTSSAEHAVSRAASLKSKIKLDSNISNWISRSSVKNENSTINSSRRQSLDNILGPTSEKVKEIFSQGIMMLNISSLTERRNSEPRPSSALGLESDGKPISCKKVPSPLEKTLTYLTSNTDDDTTGSDTDSLASCDMLTEEQIQSLMLDRDIDLVCEQMFGTPITEVCPKFGAANGSEASVENALNTQP